MRVSKRSSDSKRRAPAQRRAKATVEAVLDAVSRILRKEGVAAVTTNRIAAIAGVSIGSVYQYFADKRAIFLALRERHAEEMTRLIETTLVEHASSKLDAIVRALIEAMVTGHAKDAELNELLWTEVPHHGSGTAAREIRLRGAWRLALNGKVRGDLDRTVYFVLPMVLAFVHAIMARPKSMSLASAKDDAVRAVVAFVKSA